MKNKDIYFDYIEEFADYVVERVENDEDLYLTVVGRFEEVKTILKELMCYEFVNFESIHLESPIIDGYADEFVLSIWMNDGILELGCEKLKDEAGDYTNPCGDETYLFDNCSSKIMPLCEGSDLYIVDIIDECDCDEDCDECCPCECHCGDSCVEYSKTDDDEIHGFTASKSNSNGYYSYSFYTSNKLSKSDVQDLLKEFGF